MYNINPSCYLPSGITQYLPKYIACPPPPSYFSSAYATLISPFSGTYTTLRTAMDALLSLPFLSFLLIPTMTSYSTSLNLLFFYLTWATLVLSHPPLRVEIVASLAIRLLFYVFPSLVFLSFDLLLPSASENFKAMGPSALPLRNASQKRTMRFLKVIGWSLLNVFLSVMFQSAIEILLTRVLLVRSALRVTTALPMPWAIFKDLTRGYILREIVAYTIHRYMLHSDVRSGPLAMLTTYHESWFHSSISVPFPLSATFDHPITFLIRSFIPTYAPAMLFRFHLLTYMLYLLLISLEETWTYSGYSSVPTNFILGGIARRTDNHCVCGGNGNFGPWGLCDWIMGTSVGGDLLTDVVDEADAHDLNGKVDRMVVKAKRKGSEKVKAAMNKSRSRDGESARRRRRADS